jgi:mRNA interferase RelE/StbE
MYKIVVEHKAAKEIESLPKEIIKHIIGEIRGLQINPRPKGSKKLVGEIGWRIRIRNYRVLYTIEDNKKLVTIYRVKHRKEVYR